MRTHTGEKPFACPHCDYRAATKGTLNRHIKRLHEWLFDPPPPLISMHKILETPLSADVRMNNITQVGLKCPQCSGIFASTSAFKQHMETYHSTTPEPSTMTSAESNQNQNYDDKTSASSFSASDDIRNYGSGLPPPLKK